MLESVMFGFVLATFLYASIAGWLWLFSFKGDDHILTYNEVMERIKNSERQYDRM